MILRFVVVGSPGCNGSQAFDPGLIEHQASAPSSMVLDEAYASSRETSAPSPKVTCRKRSRFVLTDHGKTLADRWCISRAFRAVNLERRQRVPADERRFRNAHDVCDRVREEGRRCSYPADATNHLPTLTDETPTKQIAALKECFILSDTTTVTDNILAISVARSCVTTAYVKYTTATDTAPGQGCSSRCTEDMLRRSFRGCRTCLRIGASAWSGLCSQTFRPVDPYALWSSYI